MTEEDRQATLASAITYWFPIRWPDGGSMYARVTYEFTGDVTSGGIQVTATKDEGTPVVIDFTNEDCYGDAKLSAADAMVKFLAAFGS